MNPLLKTLIVYGLEYFVAHEPTFANHVSNAEVKKLGGELVNLCKALLPMVQAL